MSSIKGQTKKRRETQKHGYVKTKTGDDKFVGGAAATRLNAVRALRTGRRGRGNRILRPGEVEESQQQVSSSLSGMERFFASLLKGEAVDFLNTDATATWFQICKRLNLPFPATSLKHCYDDQRQHFLYRAALVMEEARYAVAEGLKRFQHMAFQQENLKSNQRKRTGHRVREARPASHTMLLSLAGVEVREKHGFCTLTFSKDRGKFTPDEIQNLRQGTVFACVSQNLAPTVANSVLGCILASSRDSMIESNSLSVVVFKSVNKSQESTWWVTPVASLLTEQRKFEACANGNTHKIPFLRPLLGGQKPTHIKFTHDDSGELVAVKVENEEKELSMPSNMLLRKSRFNLPTLNATQEKAAMTFLNSQPNTITLIQGPPGTGKTTLLASIIFHYLMESIEGDKARCLMVCAPTNKAVSVLCSRFLDTFENRNELPCNVLLVGDDDKLLDDDRSRNNVGVDKKSPLRSIFLYTWIKTVVDRLSEISHFLSRPTNDAKEVSRITSLSKRLLVQLQQSLSQFPQDLGNALGRVIELIENGIEAGHRHQKEAFNTIESMKSEILDWKQDLIWQDLLSSAHIIFCTLASSGAGILKRSIGEVDDLIVDEAAASCEPEMYIPFHYRPQRLLAVGDPRQLPATVMSKIAADRGLSKSLHERLMYDAGYPHIMLDVQYRMHPAISQFPSRYFYDGKVQDGPNVLRNHSKSNLLLNRANLLFLQVNGSEKQCRFGSFENHAEAQAVVQLVQKASKRLQGQWQSADRIRVITFYAAQVLLIKNYLRRCGMSDVVVATVDSSQGSEADIVIVSLVRSYGNSKHSSVGFLSDDRRMNVAITRAKYQLICVGNVERMAALTNPKAQTVRALSSDAISRNCLLPSVQGGNNDQDKRRLPDSGNNGREKRFRLGETWLASNKTRPVSASREDKINSRSIVHQSQNEDNRKSMKDERHEKNLGNGLGASGENQFTPKNEENPKATVLQKSNGSPCSSKSRVLLCGSSSDTTSTSSSNSSSAGSDCTVSDLSDQKEISRAVRSWNASTSPPFTAKAATRSEYGSDNDDFDCRLGNNLCKASVPVWLQPEADGLTFPDGGVASTIENKEGQSFTSHEAESPVADSGRSEMPLRLYTTMVMSDDSASYGDNRSELEWNADQDDGNLNLEPT